MPEYSVRIGRWKPANVRLVFATDSEVIEFVTGHSIGHLTEIWDGERLVKRFEEIPLTPWSGTGFAESGGGS